MDTDSFYLAIFGDSLDEIANLGMEQVCKTCKNKQLTPDEFSERTSGLFKPESVATRGLWITAKCYFVQNEAGKIKYSCKGVSKK